MDKQIQLLNKILNTYPQATKAAYKNDITQFQEHYQKSVLDANMEDFLDYYKYLVAQYENASVNRKIHSLSAILTKAEALEIITSNPVKKLKALGQLKTLNIRHSKALFTLSDIKEALKRCQDERLDLIIRALYNTGLRISELINIRKKDVTVSGNTVQVSIRGKGNKAGDIYMPMRLYKKIQYTFREQSEYLFVTEKGKKYNRTVIYKKILILFAQIGIKATPHLFRHFYAKDRIEKTGDIKGVAEALRHSSTQITLDVYVESKLTPENANVDES